MNNTSQWIILMPRDDGKWQTHDGQVIEPLDERVAAGLLDLAVDESHIHQMQPVHLSIDKTITTADTAEIQIEGGAAFLDRLKDSDR
ncbi:MAG: hypothetical protein AAGJ50_14755 [Pseudomonadota bacterium]